MQPTADYIRPNSVEEALAALREVEGARLIAGGTDLMIALREGRVHPPRLVDISQVEELTGVWREAEDLCIGGAARVYDVISDPYVQRRFPALVDAGRLLGGRQIQNMATVAGNLCNASPAAELAGPLLVFEAQIEAAGPAGTRRIPLDEFWSGPGSTALAEGEIVTSIRIPARVRGEQTAYRRVDIRHSVDIALVSASARLEADGGRIRLARLALGAVAPTPIRLREAEAVLEGETITDEVLDRVRHLARTAARPISDVRASADYRRAMAGVLAARVLALAWRRADA